MIDSIFVAMTGLNGFEKGLRVISNNTANLDTPGFKGSALRFADLVYSGGALGHDSGAVGQQGYGMATLGTYLDFKQGQLQNTGNGLDLAIDGLGFFVLRDANGNTRYSRNGQFKFDTAGNLVSNTTGAQVLGFDGGGALTPISIAALRTSAAHATTAVTFNGNLSSAVTTNTVTNLTVVDNGGNTHTLSARFDAVTGTPGAWNITLFEGTTQVGTGQVTFQNGVPGAANSRVPITYTPTGGSPVALTLDFSGNVTSYNSGSSSTLAVGSQDGYGPGVLTGAAFDAAGVLTLSYSNGQTARGGRLLLARFSSEDAVEATGNNEFSAKDARGWEVGVAGERGFGAVKSGMVEASNVDLSAEFSNLVIMQRGYQACSQVVSTANEMLADLFAMRGK